MKKEKPMRRACRFCFAAVLYISTLIFVTSEPANALLKPEEVLIVVNTESPESLHIGRLYSRLRHIPESHITGISAPLQDGISRNQYDDLIASPLKKIIGNFQDDGKRIRCIVTVYGVPLRIGNQRPSDVSEDDIKKHTDLLSKKKDALSEMEKRRREGKDFKKIPNFIDKLRAEVKKLKFELDHLKGNDTAAAVDSELALLLFPPYELSGWQPNPAFIPFSGRISSKNKILMVSRIDAPSPELAEKMIRTGIDVERKGLSGKIYLDARGLTGNSDYARFDDDIRRTANILEKGSMAVVLDNKPGLFGQGDAPDAALYCGWYSLGEYRDAFEWAKGAVGYHVASSEAVSLHDPTRKYWVKSMLEKGVIASIGPVTEPYLTAFPPPSLFFQLLMSGQYSLAEVFAMTNPFLSWQMILVGDPLYNPFRVKPAYPLKDPPPPPQ